MVKVTSLLIKAGSRHGFSFGVRAWSEMKIWCTKSRVQSGLSRLNAVTHTAAKSFITSSTSVAEGVYYILVMNSGCCHGSDSKAMASVWCGTLTCG